MLRDLFITMIVFGLLPLVVMRPWVGILLFSWLSFMNPHRLTYGFAYGFPFAQTVAIVTIAAAIFNKDRNPLSKSAPVWILLIFLLWQLISTLYAFYPDAARGELVRTIKIYLMVFLTLSIISRPLHLRYLVWVVALSIGFFGVKGGIFSISTGGSYRIWGPQGTFIEGNNEIGLALLMVLPLFVYLASSESHKWLKRGLYVSSILILISVVGTYSRGALVGLFCMGAFLWLKSNHKFITLMTGLLFALGVFAFMPQTWFDRMNTTTNYEEDRSAMSRLTAWGVATEVAKRNVTGGGYQALSEINTYRTYGQTAEVRGRTKSTDAHSIYFEVLGEHGFIGLVIFITFIIAGWLQGSWVIRRAKGRPELDDIAAMCRMIQVGIVAYVSAGAFLGLAYFDLFYQMVAMLVLARFFVAAHLDGKKYPEWSADASVAEAARALPFLITKKPPSVLAGCPTAASAVVLNR